MGIELREAGFDVGILILGCSSPSAFEPIVRYDMACTLCDLSGARALSDEAVKNGKRVSVHIKVDTGMGRIGIPPDETVGFIESLLSLPGLSIEGGIHAFSKRRRAGSIIHPISGGSFSQYHRQPAASRHRRKAVSRFE